MDRLDPTSALLEALGDWARPAGPLYRRLATALSHAITTGELACGQRLPAERSLAAALAVSRATVVAAYDELRAIGMVTSRRGSGTTVSALPPTAASGRAPDGHAKALFRRLVDGAGPMISLATAAEPAAEEVAHALEEVARHDLPELMAQAGYHPRGLPALREAVAARYAELGLPTEADQVLITTGAAQAIGLIARMYVPRGAHVVVESPGWPGCFDIFRAEGARLLGVALDDEGIRIDELARVLREHRPALICLMPTFHNPTGTLMSASRRRRVAELAAQHSVPVVEDNAYPWTAQRPAPLAAHAGADATVLTVESLTKTVWGGLRIGWLRAPEHAADRLARYKALADLGNPLLDQALAARLLPRLTEIEARHTASARSRLDQLGALLTDRLPEWSWHAPDGGTALWIDIGADTRTFAQVALRHGVEVVPGALLDPSGGHEHWLRLPFTFPPSVLTELVERLRRAWQELSR
ncbi:PLP-dependent aminotransferase family protein [Allokutzneria sp. NRRL B-24872]|uniref:aminotransferase-like domain-containing protein n=1 Tax=Allokutzneria sp. NRRL B-24872 TaxID=1137961 RepID=UPI00352D7F59